MRAAIQEILTDRRISHADSRLWMYVLANPASKEAMSVIAEKIKMGKPALTKAWQRLYKLGYLKVTKMPLRGEERRLVFRATVNGIAIPLPRLPRKAASEATEPTIWVVDKIRGMSAGEEFQARRWVVPGGTPRHLAMGVRLAREQGLIEVVEHAENNRYNYRVWRRK